MFQPRFPATISLNTPLSCLAAAPTFHMAPAQLDEPSDIDAGGRSASAELAPRSFTIDADVAGLPVR